MSLRTHAWSEGALAAVITLSAACGAPARLFVDLPPGSAGAASVLLALQADAHLRAFALPSSGVLELPAQPTSGELVLTAILSARSLEDLGLSAGELPLIAAETCGARSHGFDGAAFGATIDRAERTVADWVPLEVIDPAVSAARISGPCPCAALVAAGEYTIDGAEGINVLASLPEGVLAQVSMNGAPREVLLGASGHDNVELMPSSGAFAAGYVAPDGEIWLAQRSGIVVRGRLGRGFVRTATLPTSTVERIDGARGAAAPELWALDEAGLVFRLVGSRWERVPYAGPLPAGGRQSATLLWLAPGSAVAGPPDASYTVHFSDLRPPRIVPNGTDARGVRALAQVDGVGLLAGDFSGLGYRFQGEAWVLLPGSYPGSEMVRILPFRDGFVYFRGSELIEVVPTVERHCAPLAISPGIPEWAGVLPDGRFIAATEAPGRVIVTVIDWVR